MSRKEKITIHDIAKELKISASTVSRALNGHSRISEETRKTVLEMARKMNYQPNQLASALRKGESCILGVIVPRTDQEFFASMIRGIEEEIGDSGYHVILCQSNDSPEKERSNITALLNLQVAGIIASPVEEISHLDQFERILHRQIPLIMVNHSHDAARGSSVVADEFLGACLVTEHLIAQQCRRIIHFAGPQNLPSFRDRRRGYEEALRRHHLPVKEEWIMQGELSFETGRLLAEEICRMDPLPDALFSANDLAAMGAMEVFRKKGVDIPGEIAIAGFGHESFSSYVDPALTTVNLRSDRMGQGAARLLLNQMKRSGQQEKSVTVITPELIVRASSLRIVRNMAV